MISLLWFNDWWSLAKITSEFCENKINSPTSENVLVSSFKHSGGNDLRLQTIFLLSLYPWRVSLVELKNLHFHYILTKYRKWYFTIFFFKLNYNNYIISFLIKFREYWSVVRRCWKEYFTINHILSDYEHLHF
jgi:hypothetical protein